MSQNHDIWRCSDCLKCSFEFQFRGCFLGLCAGSLLLMPTTCEFCGHNSCTQEITLWLEGVHQFDEHGIWACLKTWNPEVFFSSFILIFLLISPNYFAKPFCMCHLICRTKNRRQKLSKAERCRTMLNACLARIQENVHESSWVLKPHVFSYLPFRISSPSINLEANWGVHRLTAGTSRAARR